MIEPDQLQHTFRFRGEIAIGRQRPPHLPARGPQAEQPQRNVVFQRIVGEQRDDLVGARQAAMGAAMRRQIGDVLPEQLDLARIGQEIAGDLIEQCGLAGAIGADDQPALAGANQQRNILGDGKAAERLLEVSHFERVGDGIAHRAPPRIRAARLRTPGTIPVGITSTMNRNTSPSSMFQRST